jgi:hypothetical protein
MATGENEAKLVVLDQLVTELGVRRRCLQLDRDSFQGSVEPRTPANPIDRLEATGRHQPPIGIGGHALTRPSLDGGGERLVHRLLGEIEIAEKADERGKDAAGVVSIEALDRLTSPLRRVLDRQRTFPR